MGIPVPGEELAELTIPGKKPEPEKKPDSKLKEEAAPAKEPSILDTMAQSWSQSEAMRGKVPTLEHPAQRSAREGAPEGGHSPRVLTQRERDYRDSQNQWDNDRRKMGIPVPGDELATLEIPAKPQQPEKPKAKVSLADQATKLKLKDLKELSLGKLRSMQSALQKHPKFRNPAYPEGKKYDKALRMVEGAIYSKV